MFSGNFTPGPLQGGGTKRRIAGEMRMAFDPALAEF